MRAARMPPRLFVFAAAAAATSGACEWDCALNGECRGGGRCACDAGWAGPHCARLDLRPVPAAAPGYRNASMPTWGGSVVRDGAGTYHMFVDARARPSRPLAVNDSYTCNSRTVRLTAAAPGGPYRYAAEVLGRMHYNPHLLRAPDGTLLLLVVGNPDAPDPDSTEGRRYCANCWLTSRESIRLATSPSPEGPWSPPRPVFDAFPGPADRGRWDCTAQDKSAVVLRNGSVVMAYRGHACVDDWPRPAAGPPNEYIGLATAPSWRCLVAGTCNFTRARRDPLFSAQQLCARQMGTWRGGCNIEDPHLWEDARGFHMLFHGGNISAANADYWREFGQTQGAYAYARSIDGPWTLVPNAPDSPWPARTPAALPFDDGTAARLWRRQRPGLVRDARGRVTHVINGVDDTPTGDPATAGCFWQTGWTLVQPLGGG